MKPSPWICSEDQLMRFARTLWDVLRREYPALLWQGTPQLLPSDVGARNYLLASESVIVKLRRDEQSSVEREFQGLKAAPAATAPTCFGVISWSKILADSLEQRDIQRLSDLDIPVGPGLLLERIDGCSLMEPVSDDTLEQVVDRLLRIHRVPCPELPGLSVPNRPTAMLRVIQDDLVALQNRQILGAAWIRALRRALQQANSLIEEWERLSPPKIRMLCHGDLRWHNMFHNHQEVWLLDWEHAGCGDPVVDLAMMVCRTPLHSHDELRLLHAYASQCGDSSLVSRYFLLAPVVGLLCATAAILHQADVYAGWVPLVVDPVLHSQHREQALLAELTDALRRLGVPEPQTPLQIQWPKYTENSAFRGIIAVDGTAASLKSPLSRRLAQELGIPHYDTGAAYRYAALWAWCHRLNHRISSDIQILCQHLQSSDMLLLPDGSVRANGTRWDRCLRLARIDGVVGDWAALAEVRENLRPVLQQSVCVDAAVVEGRDVGTHLAPHAVRKLFVSAPRSVRAELLAERLGLTIVAAQRLLKQRDQQDATRTIAPLRPAADAVEIALHPRNFEKKLAHILKQCRADTPYISHHRARLRR